MSTAKIQRSGRHKAQRWKLQRLGEGDGLKGCNTFPKDFSGARALPASVHMSQMIEWIRSCQSQDVSRGPFIEDAL